MKFRVIYIFAITILPFSCADGYQKIDGNCSWVNHNEGGQQVTKFKADHSTFEILEFEKFARDK